MMSDSGPLKSDLDSKPWTGSFFSAGGFQVVLFAAV
jgi:hypothetical protein